MMIIMEKLKKWGRSLRRRVRELVIKKGKSTGTPPERGVDVTFGNVAEIPGHRPPVAVDNDGTRPGYRTLVGDDRRRETITNVLQILANNQANNRRDMQFNTQRRLMDLPNVGPEDRAAATTVIIAAGNGYRQLETQLKQYFDNDDYVPYLQQVQKNFEDTGIWQPGMAMGNYHG